MQNATDNSYLPAGIKQTPMLKQWLKAKQKANGALLLFRMGDFYELFGDDAKVAAPILNLTLTSRDSKSANPLAMAGFPHHSASAYMAKLIGHGLKVAICEQLEDPSQAQGIVRRDITKIVTPGTVIDDQGLQPEANNYLVGLFVKNASFAIASIDVSTGEFQASSCNDERLAIDEIAKLNPSEVIYSFDFDDDDAFIAKIKELNPQLSTCRFEQSDKKNISTYQQDNITQDKYFYQEQNKPALNAILIVLAYLQKTQPILLKNIQPAKPYSLESKLLLDTTTRNHLNITGKKTDIKANGTLASIVDKSKSSMGSRMIINQLIAPSTDLSEISNRHDIVESFISEPQVTNLLRLKLQSLYDLQRLTAKIGSLSANPKDLLNLGNSLAIIPQIKQLLQESENEILIETQLTIDDLNDLFMLLNESISNSASINLKDGPTFNKGFNSQLDEYTALSISGKQQLLALENRERQNTGIANLKLKFTRVFGYYLEVTKSHLDKVPSHYTRKQTVASGERFITEELSTLEQKIASAEVKKHALELQLFDELCKKISNQTNRILTVAQQLAYLDMLSTFAQISIDYSFVRPSMLAKENFSCTIAGGRHPIAERLLDEKNEIFVPNDIILDRNRQLTVITGPNMGGKSTIMRQVALIQILAQAGCFVPAQKASLSICDRIFARVGANDDLASSQSTFMMEMSETAYILQNASQHSLILMDEVGRGTSTYDGLSIAWAIVEYLHNFVKAKALFATHYHEITQLEKSLNNLHNCHVSVQETMDNIVFLYQLKQGPALDSYGIHVAKLAGLPDKILQRARGVLQKIESGKFNDHTTTDKLLFPQLDLFSRLSSEKNSQHHQLSNKINTANNDCNEIIKKLQKININDLTPLQAINKLEQLIGLSKDYSA